MANNHYLTDGEWETLLDEIRDDEVLPFLGAGACHGYIHSASKIVELWEPELNLPPLRSKNLDEVTQFIAVDRRNNVWPKTKFIEKFIDGHPEPDYLACVEPHGVLADLPLSIYITTNYDQMMFSALDAHNNKTPRLEICRWNRDFDDEIPPSVFKQRDPVYEPDPNNPVVFHLHGVHTNKQTLVLTEDDYLDFLVELSRWNKDSKSVPRMIPSEIQSALSARTVLFVGYSFNDINFRMIFRILRKLTKSQRRQSFILQYDGDDVQDELKNYMSEYYREFEIKFVHSKASDFATDLHQRWQDRIKP